MDKFDDTEKTLLILAEECAEVIQICSKILRFGLNDHYNRFRLEQELGDTLAMIKILVRQKIINKEGLQKSLNMKLEKLKTYYK
jgi:NTP pyrophosphatase (non-canonical NTP hydrolase)